MLKSTKIAISIATIIISAMGLWSYPIIKTRYFSPTTEQSNQNDENESAISTGTDIENSDSASEDDVSADSDGSVENEDLAEEESDADVALEDDSFLEILKSDCQNGCKSFEETEDIQYCKQYCGLTETSKNAGDCDKFEDLEKDYCLKDEAIKKKDLEICEQIEDDGIQKSCRNRITEDILDAQTSSQPQL